MLYLPPASWRIIRAIMSDEELKKVLVALTRTVIGLTHTVYGDSDMIWACYQKLFEGGPDTKIPSRFRAGLHGVGALTQERDKLISQLQELLEKLNAL
jgi:hypothetical protein